MQACKLRIGEASPSQVVKAQLDVLSQRAAFLLADSSCILFSSLSAGNSSPFLIPPRCSDICFLRLRERSSIPISSSSSSDKSSETALRSNPSKHANAKSKPSEEKSRNVMEDSGSGAGFRTMAVPVDNTTSGLGNDALMFLVVKPAKDGSGTDVIGWKCSGIQFIQASLSLEDCKTISPKSSHCSSRIARFDDIPHGSFVGISASINVITLYSPATSKVWILSAKLTGRGQDHGTVKSAVQDQSDSFTSLHLIKCAVLEFSGPVYDLHLSLQHLLVGQFGGVRVWSLRPLIKRQKMSRKRSLTLDTNAQNKEEQVKCGKPQQENNVDVKKTGRLRGFIDQYSTTQERVKCENLQELSMTRKKNGFHEMALLGNGFIHLDLNAISASVDKPNSGEEKIEFHRYHYTGNSSEQFISNENVESISRQNGVVLINGSRGNSPEYRGNILSTYPAEEELHSQQKISQSSGISSSLSAASSAPTFCGGTHKTAALSSSCHSLTSSGSETCGVEKEHFTNGVKEGAFIPFFNDLHLMKASEPFVNMKKDEQAVSMHKLSEKEYLILDSQGKLHILALRHSFSDGELKLQQSQVFSYAVMQPLSCAMKIRVLAVLPVDQSAERSRSHATRMIWVSDGSHTIYIMLLASRDISKDVLRENSAELIKELTVIHTVFTTDRIISLSAISGNSVLVQTEGSMVAYSLHET